MANVIEIIAKFKDEISGNIKIITENIAAIGDESITVSDESQEAFSKMLDGFNTTIDGISKGIVIFDKVRDAAKILYAETVSKALAIAGEIEELSRVSGDAPENMSALRVAAQEAGVDFDDLYKALENLNKTGVAPTVDNLVAIATEYTNLQDPIEKAKLLTENFGTAGDEIAPMLEAIAGGVKEVQNSGLIFTEADIQAANDYEAAVSRLKSAWDGIASTIGVVIVSDLADILSQDSGAVTILQRQVGDLASSLLNATTITKDEYISIMQTAYTQNRTTGDSVEVLTDLLDMYGGMAADATTATEDVTDSTEGLSKAEQELSAAALAAAEAQAQMKLELDKITSLDTNYKGIIDLAYEYTDILADIAEQQAILANPDLGEEEYEAARLKIKELEGTMTDLANQVTLDMFQATIAIGGVTEAELAAYMQMAIDMGLMSEEGAQAAMDAYGNAIATINGYEIDEKTGNVSIDAVAAFLTLDLLQAYALKDKEAKAIFKVQYEYGVPGDWQDEHDLGGQAYPANGQAIHAVAAAAAAGAAASTPYYWVGERGPEPFFPSQDGRIVSNTQAMAALRGGADSGESIVVNINTPMNFADKAWVERTLAPYIQKGIREAAIRG